MISFPNAKINLGLNIVDKRPDGYHNIETVFYPIGLTDALEFVETSQGVTTISISGIHVDGDPENNLVMKAYRLLAADFDLPSLSIFLRKNIPFGAGLGGGSSDAAAMLLMLNQKYELHLSEFELERYSLQLGSDCPFFVKNKPVFASGRGEDFRPVNLSLQGMYLILVKPDVFVSTAEAYSKCTPVRPINSLEQIITTPVASWSDCMFNDFEQSVFINHPLIRDIKDTMYRLGAVYASMSGSGSSVYGLFQTPVSVNSEFGNAFIWTEKLD